MWRLRKLPALREASAAAAACAFCVPAGLLPAGAPPKKPDMPSRAATCPNPEMTLDVACAAAAAACWACPCLPTPGTRAGDGKRSAFLALAGGVRKCADACSAFS